MITTLSEWVYYLLGGSESANSYKCDGQSVNENKRPDDVSSRPNDFCEPSSTHCPLPEGCEKSKILGKAMIRQLLKVLPPRADGYLWSMVYSSDAHGFLLKTLYKHMDDINDTMTPCLLVIRDLDGRIFGACVSSPICMNVHFYGRGDSCFLFKFIPKSHQQSSPHHDNACAHSEEVESRTNEAAILDIFPYTGENEYMVMASMNSLIIGSSDGRYGLHIDDALHRGRSQHCATFDNDCLASTEDFVIADIEVWAFTLN